MKKTRLVLPWLFVAVALAAAPSIAPSGGKVMLTYATWNLGTPEEDNLERLMLKAWNAENPGVQVVPAAGVEMGDRWMGSLAAAAAAGRFPDVVMLTTMPDYLADDWLADITSLASADPEWAALPGLVRTSTTMGFRIYLVPFAQQVGGFFVNKDLLAANKVKIPDQGWTVAEFTSIVKTMTRPGMPMVGLAEEIDIPSWYPIAATSSYGWFSWDGRAYHLDSPEFRAGVDLARSFFVNGQVWERLPDSARKSIGAGGSGEAFSRGYAALMWGDTRALGDASKWTFAWDFLPIPGSGGRVVGMPEYLGIGKSTRNLAEAYGFAKHMSAFSRKGLLERIDLVQRGAGRLSIGTVPLTKDPDVLKAYLPFVNVPSLGKVLANLDNEVLEPLKWVPGYRFSRWNAKVGTDTTIGDVLRGAVRGDVKFADVAGRLNQIANQQYQDALRALLEQGRD